MSERADSMSWLRDGVPLTLLLDLLPAGGPVSAEIYTAEPADVAWLTPAATA